jgi:cysteinyl-tRNA synthetase
MPWSGDVIRFAMLMTHYRQPIDWTPTRLAAAWYNLETFMSLGKARLGFNESTDIAADRQINTAQVSKNLLGFLLEDLNTPAAIQAHLSSLVDEARKDDDAGVAAARQILVDCLFLGIDPFRSLRNEWQQQDGEEIEKQIERRKSARARKDWKESDRIRDELAKVGVELEDHKDGTTTWKLKRVA